MINNPLQSESSSTITGSAIQLMNPLSADMQYLRTSLIPGALKVVAQNINYGEKNLNLFEVGKVFNKETGSEIKSFDDFTEIQKIVFILTGKFQRKEWNQPEKLTDIFLLKGLLKSFECKILLDNVLNDSYYHSKESLFDYTFTKIYKNVVVGSGGRLKKDVLKNFDIEQDVFCFEYNIDELIKIGTGTKKYSEPLKFPKVVRDFAFIFDKSAHYEDVKKYILQRGSGLLKSVELFDLFESESLGENKLSMAFTLEYFSLVRTLTENEVEKEFLRLISEITEKFNAKLRG